jgi:hypothetical protein
MFYVKNMLDKMTKEEEKIWKLVNEWCDEQYHPIPDWNRRVLMDRIYGLLKPEEGR